MKNIYAIAHKELRSYFVSPIAYVVVGFFSILFGYFFVASLSIMVRFSTQAGMYGMGEFDWLVRTLIEAEQRYGIAEPCCNYEHSNEGHHTKYGQSPKGD